MADENFNILKEAVTKDPERWPGGFEEYMNSAKGSYFMRCAERAAIKEGLYSDMAGALGGIQKKVIEAAKPALIGREIIWVVPTTEALVRFYKAKLGKAYVVGETEPIEAPEREETSDVTATIEIAYKAEVTKSMIEDAPFDVLSRIAEEGARAVAQLETEKIIALYHGIAAGNLAGGAEIATNEGASFVWADVLSLWSPVEQANFDPKVLAIHPREMQGLLSANQFIQSLYYAPETTIRRGVYELPVLGMKIVHSSLIPAVDATHNHKFAIDTDVAGVMILRRDITTEPFENPGKLRTGVIVSERIGLKTLRESAVARGA